MGTEFRPVKGGAKKGRVEDGERRGARVLAGLDRGVHADEVLVVEDAQDLRLDEGLERAEGAEAEVQREVRPEDVVRPEGVAR
jgi:hypothetical protein